MVFRAASCWIVRRQPLIGIWIRICAERFNGPIWRGPLQRQRSSAAASRAGNPVPLVVSVWAPVESGRQDYLPAGGERVIETPLPPSEADLIAPRDASEEEENEPGGWQAPDTGRGSIG